MMRRLSSRTTFFYKRVFPVLWFGFLAVFVAIALITQVRAPDATMLPFLVIPVLMIVFGVVLMRRLVFDLVDEVYDEGDTLLVRNGGDEAHIALADIMNVGYSPLINPPRVTLTLRIPSVFGDTISFCAPVRLLPFASSPLIDELIERIDAARRRR